MARSRDADARWLSRARAEGTAADKVSAAALLAGDSPAGAGLAALGDLLKLAGKRAGARSGAVAALDALSDLFCGPLLPAGRRLVPLAARPRAQLEEILREGGVEAFLNPSVSYSAASAANRPRRLACARVLLYWGLEDALRRRASDYLSLLEAASRDGLDVVKRASARGASNLLKSRPEGEARALALLVNKLGDPDRRSASDASHALMRVLDEHPAMAPVVAADVERAAFRPGQAPRARYACVLFLSSLPVPRGEAGGRMAERLVDAYFGLFRGVLDGKLSSSAAEEAKDEAAASLSKEARHKQKEKLRKKLAKQKRRGGKHFQQRGRQDRKNGVAAAAGAGAGGGGGNGDKDGGVGAALRGGRVEGIDARLLGDLLTGVRRAVPFLPGVASSEALAEKHGAALYGLASSAAPFAVGVQALALLFQLLDGSGSGSGDAAAKRRNGSASSSPPSEEKPAASSSSATGGAVSDRFYRSLYARLSDPRAPGSARAGAFLSLVYRAARADPSPRRAAAFVKKLLQGAAAAPGASYAAGCLLLVSELAREQRALWGLVSQPEEAEDDDDEERRGEARRRKKWVPAARGDDDEDAPTAPSTPPPASPSCWPLPGCGYDPTKREPLFCGASRSGLWELSPLAAHAHPSVAAFARSLLAGEPISYDGDPLRDFSPVAAVDKIIAKKAKKFSPRASAVGVGRGVTASATAAKAAAESVAGLVASRPDELFLRALDAAKAENAGVRKAGKEQKEKQRKKGGEEDEASSEEEEEEGGGGGKGRLRAFEESDEEGEDSDAAIDAFLAGAEDDAGDDGEDDDDGVAFDSALADALAEDAAVHSVAAATGGGGGGGKGKRKAAAGGKAAAETSDSDSGSESEEEEEESGGKDEDGSDDDSGEGIRNDEDDDDDDDGSDEGESDEEASDGSDDEEGSEETEEASPEDDDDGGNDGGDDDEENEEELDLDLPSASGSEELTTSASTSVSDDEIEGNPWVMAPASALEKKRKEKRGRDEGEGESESDDDESEFSEDDDDLSDSSDGGVDDDAPAFASAEDFKDLLDRDEAGEDVSAAAAARAGKEARGKGKSNKPVPAARKRAKRG